MERLAEMGLKEYIEELGSKSPVPGGGGTAALAGALGAALGRMVGSLTVGKRKYAAVEEEMQKAREEAGRLSKKLLALVDVDAQAFEPLSKAYSLPKETVAQRTHRGVVMEACLREAAGVPLVILETLDEAVPLLTFFSANGSVLALSDAGCGAALVQAAAKSALLNVLINTKSMTDRIYAEKVAEKARGLCQRINAGTAVIYEQVLARYE